MIALLGLGSLAAACGGTSPAATENGSTTTSGGVTTPTEDPGHVVAPITGSTTTFPREVAGRPLNPVVDSGQQIAITSTGFEPAELYADDTLPVVWTNLSGSPQRITFVALPVHSAVIPEGGQFVWNAHGAGLTIAYHTATGLHGILRLQPDTDF